MSELRCGGVRINPAENGWSVTLDSYETSLHYMFNEWGLVMDFLRTVEVKTMIRPLGQDGVGYGNAAVPTGGLLR